MDAITKELSNPAWWFTAVLAAIAINILSSYVKGWTDRHLARWSERRRERSKAERDTWEKEQKTMAVSQSYWHWRAQTETRCRLRAIYFIVAATVFAAIAMALIIRHPEFSLTFRIAGLALSSFYLFFGFLEQRTAMRIARSLDASAITKLREDARAISLN